MKIKFTLNYRNSTYSIDNNKIQIFLVFLASLSRKEVKKLKKKILFELLYIKKYKAMTKKIIKYKLFIQSSLLYSQLSGKLKKHTHSHIGVEIPLFTI